MFRVKICGLTNVDEALACAEAGADAIGLNFYPPSPRCVDLKTACRIVAALPKTVRKVGVFVNTAAADVRRIADEVGLDFVQLHGDEPPAMVAEFAGRGVLKAFRFRAGEADRVSEYLAAVNAAGGRLDGVLIDAFQPGSYGGTGALADWADVRRLASRLLPLPLILAGGLRPENVAEAIQSVRPAAVDTASGVESSPGRKDASRVREFVQNALAGFSSLVAMPPGVEGIG